MAYILTREIKLRRGPKGKSHRPTGATILDCAKATSAIDDRSERCIEQDGRENGRAKMIELWLVFGSICIAKYVLFARHMVRERR